MISERPLRSIVAEDAVLPQGRGPVHLTVDDDGRIASLTPLQHIPARLWDAADLAVDRGQTLMPGGVDSHVHLNEPGRTHWEGFASGTRAAAAGGITTVVDMPLNSLPPTITVDALKTKRRAASGQLTVDTAYWGGAVPSSLGELERLWEAGVAGFKCFTAPSGVDEFPPLNHHLLLRAMREIAAFNGLLIVHAEAPEHLVESPAPSSKFVDFLRTRPDRAEVQAVRAIIQGIQETGCRTHILHLSSAAALEPVAQAKAQGLPLTVETCPHYLTLSAESIPDAAPEFKCCPPVRDCGNQEALWHGLGEGLIDMVVSDHSPATAEEKFAADGDLMLAWGGISGLEVGMSAVAGHALDRGHGLVDIARWMAQAPAALAGLTNKGRLEVGADADLAVWDPAHVWTVRAEELHHKNPISAYDGLTMTGAPVLTILRGNVIARRGHDDRGREGVEFSTRSGRDLPLEH